MKKKRKHHNRIKLVSISRLKHQLDTIFSMYIRLRDMGDDGLVPCITCNRRLPLKEIQAGHFQSRRYLNTRYGEVNVSGQCAGCNLFRAGEQYKHGIAIDLKYGPGTAAKLEQLAHEERKIGRHEYIELIERYQDKVALLMAEKVTKGAVR